MVTIINPSLLVGLGHFGAEVARAVAHEGRRLRDHIDSPGLDNLEVVLLDEPTDLDLAAPLRDRMRKLLNLRHQMRSRPAQTTGAPRLDLFVVADLSEPSVRDHLKPLLDTAQDLAHRELAPIFAPFRSGENANFALIPLLLTPHPPAHPDGEAMRDLLLELEREHEARAPDDVIVRQIYLVEDISRHYLLDRPDLADMFASYLNFLLYSNLRSEPEIRQLYQRARVGDLFATFTCATIEFPLPHLLDAAGARLLDAAFDRLLTPTGVDLSDLHGLDHLAQPTADAREAALALIRDRCPDLDRPFPPVHDLDSPDQLRAAFSAERLEQLLAPWLDRGWLGAELERRVPSAAPSDHQARAVALSAELDDLLHGGASLVDCRDRLQEVLADAPTPEAAPEAPEATEGAPDAPTTEEITWPDPQPVRSALEATHRAIDGMVNPRTLATQGGIAAAATVALMALGVVLLPVPVVGLALLGLGGAGFGLGALWTLARAAKWWGGLRALKDGHARAAVEGAWARFMTGPEPSALTALTQQIERRQRGDQEAGQRRAAQLIEAELNALNTAIEAATAAQRELRDQIAATGMAPDPDAPTRLQGDGLLRRLLIDSDDLAFLTGRYHTEDDPDRLARLLIAQRHDPAPFAELGELLAESAGALQPLTERSVFELPEMTDRLQRHLTEALRGFADTLTFHLNFSGHEARDPSGVVHAAHRLILVSPAGADLVERARVEAQASAWQVRPKMVDPNRVHLLRVATDIHSQAIPSLQVEEAGVRVVPITTRNTLSS